MPGYEQLYNLDFGALDAAIEDWRQTVRDLDGLAAEASQGLLTKLTASGWKGRNATVSRAFILRSGSQFEYAHEQARAVHAILTEFRATQRAHREALRELAAEAQQKGLYITSGGVVMERLDGPYTDAGLEQQGQPLGSAFSERQGDIEHFTARIRMILAEAATADETATRALRDNAGEDRDHFAPVAAADLLDAQRAQGIADAQEYLELIEAAAYATQEGLDRLNELAAAQKDNEYFASYLAAGLGADGTLRFWADVLDGPGSGEVTDEYRDAVLQLRENLGVTFGTASHSDRPGMSEWRNEIIALGSRRVGTASSMDPYGFQIMSDLMTHGGYEKDWLVDYGVALVESEQELALDAGPFWASAAPADAYRRVIGDEYRTDPMTGFMRALGNNPDAATAFALLDDEQQPDTSAAAHARAEEGQAGQDYLGYILGERANHSPDGDSALYEEAGQALFAAATGINPHDPAAVYVEHSAHHEAARDRILELGSGLGDDFPPEFRSPMAKMLVNHGDAVIDTAGSQLPDTPLDHRHLSDVATQISRDPQTYGVLNEGMNYLLVDSLRDTENTAGVLLEPEDTLARAGQTVGFLEQARNDALYGEMAEEESDATWNARWQYHAFGAAFNFIPELGDIVQRGMDVYTQSWLDDELARIEGRYSEEEYIVTQSRANQLAALADAWYDINSVWADGETDYRSENGRANKIGEAALLGRDTK
ncbi:hypothetical protein ACFV5N_24300 [Streptomyces sp. NPDC059853]|uniref:hypothetical protein n=1 Tax=Streptomyces sp. NPDC059853 TaxID=3346973 RepID=UPI00365FD3E9